MHRKGSRRSRLTALAVAGVAVAVAVPIASGHRQAAPKVVGSPAAGKSVFSTTCAACHTLKAAGAVGTIGPNLDKVVLSEALLIKAVTGGGATVMTKAALAKYPARMTAYKGTLSTAQIQNVAAYVYASTHK